MKRLIMLIAAVAAVTANATRIITNEVNIAAGGVLATPVQIHQTQLKTYLANPDYNQWTNLTTNGGTDYDRPMLTKLVWGDAGRSIVYTNLTPGVTYNYSVEKNNHEMLEGSFTTEAEPPKTLLTRTSPTVYVGNFRDLGGWPIPGSNGKRTNFGVFFRSANIDNYFLRGDNRAWNVLHSEFGINTELELRYSDFYTVTVNGNTDSIEDESYYFTNCFQIAQSVGYGPENAFTTAPSVNDGSIRYFRVNMTTQFSLSGTYSNSIKRAFQVLGNKARHPVLFHCAGGRDRTGFIAFIIESLCGLHEDSLYHDHMMITLASQGTMYAERLDGNIRWLYTQSLGGVPRFTRYGDSLAGHVRAYLEDIGVTAAQIEAVTTAYVDETPSEVLARVNAYETAHHYRTVYFVTEDMQRTNAVYRVGDETLPREPVLAKDDHYSSYGLSRPGFIFLGWSAEENNTRKSLWQREPKAIDLGELPGDTVTDPAVLARGGDIVKKIDDGAVTSYIHYFYHPEAASQFVNNTGSALNLRYLAVGGGGSGGSGYTSFDYHTGGGGGGGGGVVGSSYVLAADGVLDINVGDGSYSSDDRYMIGCPAEATTIYDGSTEVVSAPGGGNGSSATSAKAGRTGDTPTSGAAGGGGAYGKAGAAGAFTSQERGIAYSANKGGDCTRMKITAGAATNYYYAAGGGGGAGGAGANGDNVNGVSGNGGIGVASDITGETRYYGAGGGGGGVLDKTMRDNYAAQYPDGFGAGVGGNGVGGNGGYSQGGVFTMATSGADGFGAGGGGAPSDNGGTRYPSTASSTSTITGGDGGSGIVIIRYDIDSSPAKGGDRVYTIPSSKPGYTDYVHVFSSVGAAKSFVNPTDEAISVRYLVVGGGGSGGGAYAASSYQYGGSGGGGGGVAGATATLGAGETWTITVGEGSVANKSRYYTGTTAGASSIYNGSTEIVTAPGGGNGGSAANAGTGRTGVEPTEGAAGGGGKPSAAGASGTFASYEGGTVYSMNAGGTGAHLSITVNGVKIRLNGTGGGGGAGGAGGNANGAGCISGNGGIGVASDITGETLYYGGGGGAGGMFENCIRTNATILADFPNGVAGGVGGNGGGGNGGYYQNGVFTMATDGADGFGGGGGGAVSDNDRVIYPSDAQNTTVVGGNGGAGVVILRYSVKNADTPENWVYNTSTGTISDGDWEIAVSVYSGTGLRTLANCVLTRPGEPKELDLGKPIEDTNGNITDYHLVRFSSSSFTNCQEISSLKLGRGITISTSSFAYCSNIVGTVVIPTSCTIGQNAFFHCVGIERLEFEDGAEGNQAFSGTSQFYNCAGLKSISAIPAAITHIPTNCFYGATSLAGELYAPGVKCIRRQAFYSCKLTSLKLPAVEEIEHYSFYNCPIEVAVLGSETSEALTFPDGGNHVFYKIATNAKFYFPGKAPVLPYCETSTDGYKMTYAYVFGNNTGNGSLQLYGNWREDPVGWQKIIDEVGVPIASETRSASSRVLADSYLSVKGTVNWWYNYSDAKTAYYAWLVDWAEGAVPAGSDRPALIVDDDLAEKLGVDITTPAGIAAAKTALGNTEENGFKVWENYVLGIDGTSAANVPLINFRTASAANKLAFGLDNVSLNAGSGVTPTFQLKGAAALSGPYEVEASNATGEFEVNLTDDKLKLYKIGFEFE